MKITYTEKKFMDFIWAHEPVRSKEIVEYCRDCFGWKNTTTYTFLKRLEEKGIIVNDSSTVHSLISQSQIEEDVSREVISDGFRNSLPLFLTAFLNGQKLSKEECDELMALIKSHREDS